MAGLAPGAAAGRRVAGRGRVVAFLGPDGAGKSTAIASLRRRLAASGVAARTFHWRVPWRESRQSCEECDVVIDPHARPAKGWFASLAQIGFHLLTAWPAWWRWVGPARRHGEWVLLDRCFLDLLCDPRRYRYGGPGWVARAAAAVMPRPDHLLVLHAPADAILARKREVAPDELTRQLAAYRACGLARGGILIDANDTHDVVDGRIAQVLGIGRA